MVAMRFVGSHCRIGEKVLDRFGTRVSLKEEFVDEAIKGGAALLHEQDFQNIGFTPHDLRVWADPFMSKDYVPANEDEATSKAEFEAKKALAVEMYIARRSELLNP